MTFPTMPTFTQRSSNGAASHGGVLRSSSLANGLSASLKPPDIRPTLPDTRVIMSSSNSVAMCQCGCESRPRLVTQTQVSEWTRRSTFTLLHASLALTVYLILGTVTFSAIELPVERNHLREVKRKLESNAIRLTNSIINSTVEQVCEPDHDNDASNTTRSQCMNKVRVAELEQRTFDMINGVLDELEIMEFRADPSSNEVNPHWVYHGAFHFCITTITTIGYGNFVPRSEVGQVLTVFYCMLGIPLFFFLCSQCCKLFSFCFYSIRRKFQVDSNRIKLVLYYCSCVLMIHTFLFIVPILVLTFQEGLSPLSAFYFLVVTLSTVGYGDYNPLDPVYNASGTTHQVLLNVATWCYMVVGLSLFGNLVRFIQYHIEKATGICESKFITKVCVCCCPNWLRKQQSNSSAASSGMVNNTTAVTCDNVVQLQDVSDNPHPTGTCQYCHNHLENCSTCDAFSSARTEFSQFRSLTNTSVNSEHK